MTRRDDFERALVELSVARPGGDLCSPFASALGVEGAAVSTLGDPLGSQTICASDATAARLDEIQVDLGEGPCWDALASGLPVLESDLRDRSSGRWPTARTAMRELGVGAVYSFPLRFGTLGIGSVDLYARTPGRLSLMQVGDASALAAITARQVLRWSLEDLAGAEPEEPSEEEDRRAEGPYSRREVHQATGMVAAQLAIDVDDALLVIRGNAYANGRSVREVAADVVARRIVFR
jgi:hypothetical protein